MKALAGKTALVTGASRGIGAAISRALASGGARVALVARSRDRLEALADELGNGSFAVVADLSRRSQVDEAIAGIREKLNGSPDIVVNNAGVFSITPIEDTSVDEFNATLATNLSAPFTIIQSFLSAMKARGSGHIITIGSIADRQIFAGNSAYSATKFAGRALHAVLREETRASGVRATLISPSAVDTDIWEPIQYYNSDIKPDRETMLPESAVAAAVIFAVTQPGEVNVDELRLSRA